MEPSFPQILKPQITSFGSMVKNPEQVTEEDTSITPGPNESVRDTTGVNGSRKRAISRIKSTYPRKRAIQACQKCRARRTKCNNVRPACSSCLDLGVECNYAESDPSSYDAASLAILEKLSTIEQLLRTDGGSASHRQILGSASDEVTEDPSPSSHVKSLNSPTLERIRDAPPCHMNIENVLSWQVFEDQNPNLNLKSLLNDENAASSQLPPIVTDVENFPEEDLVLKFMESVFIFNPVLEEAKVQKYIRDARFNGLGWDAQSCLLLLIYAHGSLAGDAELRPPSDASESRQEQHFRQAESFFSAAQRRLGLLLCRSGVLEAQCFFLAGVYLMATMRPLEAWKMFVQALACCQSFYSGKATPNAPTEPDRRLRESIYWTCFKSELELRLELNVSETSVWDLTYPAFFPSPPDELRSQREIVWYFYLAEIALRRLGNRILNYIYSSALTNRAGSLGEDVVDSIVGFEQQATDWIRSLPRGLGLDETTPGGNVDESDLHRTLKFILKGHLLDCYEMMYWPFIADAINGESDVLSPSTRDFAQKALNVCVERIQKNEPGFFYRHHGTWLMLRSCTRSGLVLLAADRSDRVRHLLPDSWKQAVGKIVDMLRFWRRESRDIEDRLRMVERMWRLA